MVWTLQPMVEGGYDDTEKCVLCSGEVFTDTQLLGFWSKKILRSKEAKHGMTKSGHDWWW